jgi:hypothetical protein
LLALEEKPSMNVDTYPVSDSRLKNRFSNYLYRIIIVAFLLLTVEMGLRFTLGLGRPLLFISDPTFGSIPAPNQDLHRFFSHIQINEYGMRSGYFSFVKPIKERRILFVGDSVTFGTTYVDQKCIFTSLINEYYEKKSLTPIVVMNASSPGWAPSNELGFIRSKGIFDADLVVFVLNTKDLIQPFSKFIISPITPTKNPYTAIGESLDRYILPRIFGYKIPVDPGSEFSGDPTAELKTMNILGVLLDAKDLVNRNGAKLTIIFSPMVDNDTKLHKNQWDKGVDMLITWCLDKNVGIIDMRDGYSRYAESQIYFDGMHLRPLGHQIVSDEFIKTNK